MKKDERRNIYGNRYEYEKALEKVRQSTKITPNNKKKIEEFHNYCFGIGLSKERVIILSWIDSPLAIKIESEVFANQLKDFFLDLRKQAKQ